VATETPSPESYSWIPVYILHGGEQQDRELAGQIAGQLNDFDNVLCVGVEEIDRRFPRGIITGHALTILSPAIIANPERSRILASLLQKASMKPIFRRYCVARDITRDTLMQNADLCWVADDITVSNVADLPGIFGDLRTFATRDLPPEMKNPSLFMRRAHAAWLQLACTALYALLIFSYNISALAAVLLAFLWWRGAYPSLSIALAVLCSFSAGFRCNFLNPSDLWPWLGRRWKLPKRVTARRTQAFPSGPILGIGLVLGVVQTSKPAIAVACIIAGIGGQWLIDAYCRFTARARAPVSAAAAKALAVVEGGNHETRCEPAQLSIAGRSLVFTKYWDLLTTAIAVALRLYPSALAFVQNSRHAALWIAGATFAGFALPVVLSGPVKRGYMMGAKVFGLTEGFAGKSRQAMAPQRVNPNFQLMLTFEQPDMLSFAAHEQAQIQRWLELLRVSFTRFPIRHWRAGRDYVFISYAWRDDAELRVSTRVAQALADAQIDHYLDKDAPDTKYGLFRQSAAGGVADCSHFFLVVSPEIVRGRVIMREIEMAMQRWAIGMLPAVICVVEPDIAARLRADASVPLPLRFLLTFCPQMSYAESFDKDVVRFVVEFTRREGKLHDWLLLLSPSTTIEQLARLPGIVETG
jgi:hypothetical protein